MEVLVEHELGVQFLALQVDGLLLATCRLSGEGEGVYVDPVHRSDLPAGGAAECEFDLGPEEEKELCHSGIHSSFRRVILLPRTLSHHPSSPFALRPLLPRGPSILLGKRSRAALRIWSNCKG